MEVQSQFIEMQTKSPLVNTLGDFIERVVPKRCGEKEIPVLSVTKERGMVFQDDRFDATVVSRDKSNYIIVPRGFLVQGIHIDESNFGIQNLIDEGIVSPAYKLWKFKSNDVVPELIEYYLRSEMAIKYFKRHFLGATVPRRQVIKKVDFLAMPLNLPNIETQKRYFSIYQQADKSKFVGFKSQFIEMFGNAPKIKLEDYISTQSGGTPNTKKQEYYEGGDIPWLSSGEVNQGYIESTEKFITKKGLENSSAKWVPKDCVVIAMYGATAGKVGYIRIPLTTNQAVCSLLPCSEFNSIFLYYAVSQKSDWMISQCRGAAQPNISQGIIRSMELPLPQMEEQMKFVAIAEQADKSKYYNQVA